MTRSVTLRYALRSLRRNAKRSALSILGVAFGVGVGLLAMSWVGGQQAMMADAAATGGIGHLRVAPVGWNDSRSLDLRLHDGGATLEALRAADGVRVATPRAQMHGLAGLGTRSAPLTITGVDPTTEPEALRYVSAIDEGRYLEAGETGAVVLGRDTVRRLDARLDDELVITAVDAEGEMRSLMLRIVGIVATGSRAVDSSIAHVGLEDVETLSGREGAAQIVVLLDDVHAIEATHARLRGTMPEGDELLTWLDVSPEMRAGMAKGDGYQKAMLFIILLVVLLGVMSAQLTSVLERRKEFAVLAALGMRGRHLVMVLVAEGFFLGLASAAAALCWSAPIIHHIATNGVDMTAVYAQSGDRISMAGVLMPLTIYPASGAWVFVAGILLALSATITASLYPAWFASKTDPASALRVDR